jgi:hypothetical protein
MGTLHSQGTIAEIIECTKTLGCDILVTVCQAVSYIRLWDSIWIARVNIGEGLDFHLTCVEISALLPLLDCRICIVEESVIFQQH